MKPIILKLKLVPHKAVPEMETVCDEAHYMMLRYRDSDLNRIYFCAPGVWDFFDLNHKQDVEIVIQTNEPRGDNFYQIRRTEGGVYWYIDTCQGITAPWSCEVDQLLDRVVDGSVAYISAYQGG